MGGQNGRRLTHSGWGQSARRRGAAGEVGGTIHLDDKLQLRWLLVMKVREGRDWTVVTGTPATDPWVNPASVGMP